MIRDFLDQEEVTASATRTPSCWSPVSTLSSTNGPEAPDSGGRWCSATSGDGEFFPSAILSDKKCILIVRGPRVKKLGSRLLKERIAAF